MGRSHYRLQYLALCLTRSQRRIYREARDVLTLQNSLSLPCPLALALQLRSFFKIKLSEAGNREKSSLQLFALLPAIRITIGRFFKIAAAYGTVPP